jgi:hypothetical protein
MSFIAAAVIGGATALGGGYLAGQGAKDAAQIQADAAKEVAKLQYEMFQEQQAAQEPWRKAGEQALNKLIPLATEYTPFGMQQFQTDPGYQFRLQEGLKQLRSNAAARGSAFSGATLKSVQRYAQGAASDEYQNAFNRYQTERAARLNPLQSLAGVGQTAVGQLGQAGQAYASGAGEAISAGAAARASGYVGQANALANTLGQIGNIGMQYNMYRQPSMGGGSYGMNSPQAQIGYSNAVYNPSSGYYEVNF